ncbi:hypothetical protein BU23DRAFT_200085 [Bimuria novae-zelandiae CBS 107.79]|uniref:Uncharacterized protein n=1 Tax=Bimuria novae-zelandiae CBS 107.79 TaxID=1447943 RepID=A0A6A5V1W0_9PLEO|nr:hypothetical protein BU23DRAFT_200085 [Bimuria novae-zelandiae CBS 107.79]
MSICSYSRDPEPCPSKGSPDYADCHLSSPDYLSDSDTDISDSDSEPEEPKFPSTIPHFGSDLECFEEVFPSLINGLQNAGDAFEVGWLAGCVHDVILCLALHLTNNHSVFPKTKANLLVEALEARYDRPLPTGDGETCPPEGVTEWIKPKQLLDLFNLIHETVELDYPAGVPLTDKEVEFKIGEKESMFGTMLDNAIKEMWGEDEDDEDESHEEVYTMRGGWISGKFRRAKWFWCIAN